MTLGPADRRLIHDLAHQDRKHQPHKMTTREVKDALSFWRAELAKVAARCKFFEKKWVAAENAGTYSQRKVHEYRTHFKQMEAARSRCLHVISRLVNGTASDQVRPIKWDTPQKEESE
jgi:hypothetical protein